MTETGIFIAGAIITLIVFTGGMLYARASIGRFAVRDDPSTAKPVPV